MTSSGVSIGRGRFGAVMRYGNHAPYVAVKRIYIYSDRIKQCTERELKAFEKLSHSNIVKFYGHKQITHDGFAFLMTYMEFCERLSLRHVLDDPTVVYNLKTVFGWAEHLASALLSLKDNQILHRDIKPETVFVTNRFILKLGDFGLGKEMNTGSSMSLVGTDRYMSPEASGHFGKAETNYKSDLYAMGLVFWEMAERREVFSPEFENQGINAIFNDLKNGVHPPTNCDAAFKNLILECIRFDHSERPDVEDFIDRVAGLNSDYNEETFQPLTQMDQAEIQKPNCIRKENTNKRDLLQSELIIYLKKKKPSWIYGGYIFDELNAHLDDDKQEQPAPFLNRSLNDAISRLKSLAIQQSDFKMLEMFEERIRNFSKLPADYIFCNYKYPNFPPMIDQELSNFLTRQKYGGDFIENIKNALTMCEHCFRNEFKTWVIETLAALKWFDKATLAPDYFLLEAIEQIHSIIGRLSDNPFYKQWLMVSSPENYISRWGIRFLLSRKRKESQTNNIFLHKGFHIESCLKDLQEMLQNLLKDTEADQEILKNYLERYQPRECVFPYRAYRFEWGKRVDECEAIKTSDIDPETLVDYESLRKAYECAFKILVTHSKGKEKSLNQNDQISQIKTCLLDLKKPRKCPNYFYFNARELRDDESQNVDILWISQKDANPLTYFLGDDLIWKWQKTERWFRPAYTMIRVHVLIDLLSDLLLQYESSRPFVSSFHFFVIPSFFVFLLVLRARVV